MIHSARPSTEQVSVFQYALLFYGTKAHKNLYNFCQKTADKGREKPLFSVTVSIVIFHAIWQNIYAKKN